MDFLKKNRFLIGAIIALASLILVAVGLKNNVPKTGDATLSPTTSLVMETLPSPPEIVIEIISLSTPIPTTQVVATPVPVQIDTPVPSLFLSSDIAFLNEIEHRAFLYFWQQANPQTGLIKDRANNFDPDTYTVASTAAVGFGLTGICIGQERGWITPDAGYERALTTLRFYRDEMDEVHGFYYHFVDVDTGERVWESEISSIDSALFLAGALTVGQCYPGTEIETIANQLYERADFWWLLTDDGARPDEKLLGHGWKPETGFLPYRWDTYNEAMILYLLAIGSPTHPISPESWNAWSRPTDTYAGYTTFAQGPLFTHQYSHAWVDFRGQQDGLGFDYFKSSVDATLANRQFAIDNSEHFATYDDNIWGLTACDGPQGYRAYGAPPGYPDHDGTVSPAAPAGSIPFTPRLSIAALREMYTRYGDRLWGQYGFSDAFNVDQDWWDQDVIGIDLGITLLMIENYRSGLIWRTFMPHPAIQRAVEAAGFTQKEDQIAADAFEATLDSLCWVAYAPTNFNPNNGTFPSEDSIRKDLQALQDAGFTGLITYGADQYIHPIAQEIGFQGMIVGVWDPTNPLELEKAKSAGQYEIVVGYAVGNEGLDRRYDYDTLRAAMDELRQATAKPVATTEERWDYVDPSLVELGDWVFPNVHPYWHGITDPQMAVDWTFEQFHAFVQQTDKPILFKEVGLPTDGDGAIDEQAQAEYYRILQSTSTEFVFFEAFDQSWKDWEPVEPYWGLFRPDRSAKIVIQYVCNEQP